MSITRKSELRRRLAVCRGRNEQLLDRNNVLRAKLIAAEQELAITHAELDERPPETPTDQPTGERA